MTGELGKIEKPEASQFQGRRKLYLIPLVFSWEGAPAEYTEKINRYWQQVTEQIANLESKLGKVSRIYHESIPVGGDQGLKLLEKLNPFSCQITQNNCQSGAQLEAVEDAELVRESMDWESHLLMGFTSQKVARIVSNFLADAARRRFEYIAQRINETLRENESAILFIREGHAVQFPQDIEVFIIAPPSLDETHRWLRDYSVTEKKDEPNEHNADSVQKE